jgi:hypothetical protein
MVLAVLIISSDGSKRFFDNMHVHGIEDGHLLLAQGEPGSGLAANVIEHIPLETIARAETCHKADPEESESSPSWYMGSEH